MKITDIDISGLRFDNNRSLHEAHVSMKIRAFGTDAPIHLHFVCHAARARDCATSLIVEDLIADALRQARRMPGYRRGERSVELSVAQTEIARRVASA